MNNFGNIVHTIAYAILPLLFAITLHEAAHGWLASKLGDTTALLLGRVTLNPKKHIDPFGTIILPLILLILSKFTFAFGWAKPVPVNWRNLKNPRRDTALVAFAGPLSNLLMAFIWAALMKVGVIISESGATGFVENTAAFLFYAGNFGISINVILFLLNLIPIPPLDGSRVVSSILPEPFLRFYSRIEPYGAWVLLGLLFLGLLNHVLTPPMTYLITLIKQLVGL